MWSTIFNTFKKASAPNVRVSTPMEREPNTFLSNIPVALRERICLQDGELHLSEEVRGEPMVLSMLSLARRQGVIVHHWHPAEAFDREYRHGTASGLHTDSEIKSYAVKLMQAARELDASDIHITDYGTFGLVQFRRLGMLQDYTQLPGETARSLIRAIYQSMSQSSGTQFSPTERQEGRIAAREYLPSDVHSVRLHTEPLECAQARGGTGTFMAMRLLYDRTNASGTLEQRVTALGYTQADAARFQFLTERTGLTIISGPTGHGKSTLLKHVMEAMAFEHPEKSLMSIEDPPEYPLQRVKQVLVSTNVAVADARLRGQAYMNAIAGAMRSDPDVLMIGEIRYPEAAAAAIDAALTGHGVYATLHANNGFGIIKRMMSLLESAHVKDPLEYLCDHNVVAGLVYQRLIPSLCPHCRIPLQDVLKDAAYQSQVLPQAVLIRLMRVLDDLSGVYVRGEGCPACKQLGIMGQTVAAEMIITDHDLLHYLGKGEHQKAYRHWIKEQGGRTYVGHAIELINAGIADPYLTELRLGVPLNFSKVFDVFGEHSNAAGHEASGHVA